MVGELRLWMVTEYSISMASPAHDCWIFEPRSAREDESERFAGRRYVVNNTVLCTDTWPTSIQQNSVLLIHKYC